MREVGWYHREGDPPGTVRRWNGQEWIGFPIRDPDTTASTHGAAPVTVDRLEVDAHRSGWLAAAAFVGLAGVLVIAATRFFGAADRLRFSTEEIDIAGVDAVLDGLLILTVMSAALIGLGGIAFLHWLRSAATATHIAQRRTTVHKTRNRRSPVLAYLASTVLVGVAAFFLGIGVILAVPLLLAGLAVAALGAGAAPTQAARVGMLTTVLDVVAVSSTDHRTGIAALTPVKILAWWALWWGPAIIGALLWVAVSIQSPIGVTSMQTALRVTGVLLTLESLAALLIVSTIAQVTTRLR